MNIEQILVLSTAHVTPEVGSALDQAVAGSAEGLWSNDVIAYGHGTYGWLIYIPDQFDAEVPPCVEACMSLAKANGCCWLLLDRDAEATDQLQTYEW